MIKPRKCHKNEKIKIKMMKSQKKPTRKSAKSEKKEGILRKSEKNKER